MSGRVEVTTKAFCFPIPPVRGEDRVVEIPVRKNVAVPQALALHRPHQQHGNWVYWLWHAVGHCANLDQETEFVGLECAFSKTRLEHCSIAFTTCTAWYNLSSSGKMRTLVLGKCQPGSARLLRH